MLDGWYKKFCRRFPVAELNCPDDEKFCRRVLAWMLALWSVFWFAVPVLTMAGVYFDVLENLEWGRYWQWGYDKHPFVSMWITRAVYELTGSVIWLFVLNQISVALAVCCVWLLGRRFLPPLAALAAALMPLTLQYYSAWTLEFNNDVIAISVWGAAALFYYRALDRQRIADWLLTAFFCFMAVMTKYYAVVLLAAMAPMVLWPEKGRASFRHPGIYLAGIFFVLLVLPNVLWLFRFDFAPFFYAAESAANCGSLEASGWLRHAEAVASCARDVLERLAFFIPVYLLLFLRRVPVAERRRYEDFDQRFMSLLALGPFLLTVLAPVLTGAYIKATWLASCFSLLAVWLFMVFQPVVTRRKIGILVVLLWVFALMLAADTAYALLIQGPYRDRNCGYVVYPGAAIARKATELWQAACPDRPLRYVIASRKDGCNLAYYAPDKPRTCYFYDFKVSPWCTPQAIDAAGALVMWEIRLRDEGERKLPPWFGNLDPVSHRLRMLGEYEFDRLIQPWVRRVTDAPVRRVRVAFAVLAPVENGEDECHVESGR